MNQTTRVFRTTLLQSVFAAMITTALACATVRPPQPPSWPTKPQDWPTQLQTAIANYIAQPATLVSLASRAGWDLGERASRPACTSWPCASPNATADVQIDAVRGSAGYDQSTVGGHGTVVARVRNRGTMGTDRAFGARPGATVYVIAHTWDSRLIAHAEFVEVWSDASGLRAEHIGYGEYRSCPPHSDVRPAGARFGGCTHAGAPHRVPTIGGPAASDDAALLEHSGNGQIPCSPGGCCEMAT
jgi:hypothetical protein